MNRQYYKTINGFVRFLAERRVRNAFIINVYKRFGHVYGEKMSICNIYKVFQETSNHSFIDYALDWNETKEGYDFWYGVHRDFITLVNEKTI